MTPHASILCELRGTQTTPWCFCYLRWAPGIGLNVHLVGSD